MSEPSRPLRALVYGDDDIARKQVRPELGKRLHPELPEHTYIDVATAPVVIRHSDAAATSGLRAPVEG